MISIKILFGEQDIGLSIYIYGILVPCLGTRELYHIHISSVTFTLRDKKGAYV